MSWSVPFGGVCPAGSSWSRGGGCDDGGGGVVVTKFMFARWCAPDGGCTLLIDGGGVGDGVSGGVWVLGRVGKQALAPKTAPPDGVLARNLLWLCAAIFEQPP